MGGYKFSLLLLGFFQLMSYSYTAPIGECTPGVRFLSDDSDCSIFYQCANGNPVQTSCPAGLYFDSINKVCNWPDAVNCDVSTSNPNEENEEETDVEEGSGEVDDPETSTPWIGECPTGDSLGITFLQHASDCNKYFVCDHGLPVLVSCPAGLHFNIDSGICDWPDSAGCEVDLYFL